MKLKATIVVGSAMAALFLFGNAASAQSSLAAPKVVGTVTVCYYSVECTYTSAGGIGGVVDGPAFQFTNTGSEPIIDATFSIAADSKLGVKGDSFKIGTINAGASFVLIPGATDDHKKRTNTALFFYYVGPTSPRDTSDVGPNASTLAFTFNGKVGTSKVTSGKILPSASVAPSADGTVAAINFLGGPGNADGPCNDCVKPTQIATITLAGGAAASEAQSAKGTAPLTFPPKED
jgi:hypothetical protein